MPAVPRLRLTVRTEIPVRSDGVYVLYWMTAARRTHWNHALDRAVAWAKELARPLLIFEPLRVGYRWASDRLHHFIIAGMRDNAAACAEARVAYLPYVEPHAGAGRGLLERLARDACVVVGDDWPCFFHPHMQAAAARRLPVAFETVDGNGLLPLQAVPRAFERAVDFRRFLQRTLPPFLAERPQADPLQTLDWDRVAVLPSLDAWQPADLDELLDGGGIARLPIDHGVPAVAEAGGATAAASRMRGFLDQALPRYADERSDPDADAASGLSPWLHFGHLSAQEVVHAVLDRAGWTPASLATAASGGRNGWWGVDAASEAFLDELVTWRELGHAFCHHRGADADRYDGLPTWALRTLEDHAGDPRPQRYARDELEQARTHDPVWNAAQRELLHTGRMSNYLRMLWGKKVLEWSPHPRDAFAVLVELNNRWALDGRDPNSYAGIGWVFGRFDRPWAPKRPIFGSIRYMSSASTLRKLELKRWLARWSPDAAAQTRLLP